MKTRKRIVKSPTKRNEKTDPLNISLLSIVNYFIILLKTEFMKITITSTILIIIIEILVNIVFDLLNSLNVKYDRGVYFLSFYIPFLLYASYILLIIINSMLRNVIEFRNNLRRRRR